LADLNIIDETLKFKTLIGGPLEKQNFILHHCQPRFRHLYLW